MLSLLPQIRRSVLEQDFAGKVTSSKRTGQHKCFKILTAATGGAGTSKRYFLIGMKLRRHASPFRIEGSAKSFAEHLQDELITRSLDR